MRRTAALAAAMALCLTACGGSGEDDPSVDDAASDVAATSDVGATAEEASETADDADSDGGEDGADATEGSADDGDGSASADGAGAIEDCAQLVAGIEGLLAQYDALTAVPPEEAARFDEMASIILTCSPDQLTYLDSADVNAFLDS